MSRRVINAICHGLSQLTRRWIAAPSAAHRFAELDPSLENYSLEEWRTVIHYLMTSDWFVEECPRKVRGFLPENTHAAAEAIFQHLACLRLAGGRYLVLGDEDFPDILDQIDDPPLALSVLGDTDLFRLPRISVVGSRKPNPEALQQSYVLGRELALRGYGVVSGGAYGCDVAAHQGVLSAGLNPAPAVVVFAGGLHRFYPQGNSDIFRRLRQRQALLVSERLWFQTARPVDFPVRNRLVAGLSACVLIMQAGMKSGAIVTANLALRQGRDVFVLMHSEDDVNADGSRKLFFDGALGFEDAQRFIEKSFVGYRVITSG